MKNIFKALSLFSILFSCDLIAQINNSKIRSSEQASDAKSNYIKNQDYLSKSSLKDYRNYFGDSLNGFDIEAVKVDLINRHFYGQEFHTAMNYTKRDFIDRKYNLGQYAPRARVQPTSTTSGSGKPLGNSSSINVAPCVNEDFEASSVGAHTSSTAITGWIVESGSNNGTNGSCITNTAYAWTTPISEFWIVQTPIFNHPYMGTIPNSPLGGTKVAQLNNTSPGVLMTRISTTFSVTQANTLFQFAYCGSWDGSGHACCDQPFFRINMYDCTGAPLGCSSISLTPSGPNCPSGVTGYSVGSGGVSYTPSWVVKYIDLTPFIGSCVTLRVVNGDCDGGAHHGSLYFDARCGGQLVGQGLTGPGGSIAGPVSFCAGSGVAIISAPLGYSTYSWIPPITSAPLTSAQATLSTLTVTNPIPGTVYTVNLVSPSGCLFVSTNTIVFTTVNVAGIGSTTSCANGSSGSATVQGNGSGSGYNYTWVNVATSATVGTTAIVNGLAAGVYRAHITGIGSSGCGSDTASVRVYTGPAGIIQVLKPYCGNEAYLSMATGGTNYQWYNNLTPITASLGGTANSYTVVNPTNQSVYWLSYLSQYGCQDSVKFTLVSSAPGTMSVGNISWICPGGSNGTALVNMTPAAGAPGGVNSFSVYNTNTNTPAYTASIFPTASNSFAVGGLAAGSYSVKAFDGSCKYGANFTVNSYTYSFNVTPTTAILCPGNNIAANITFTSPPSATQYSYLWTPNVFLAGNANTYSSTIISPSIPVGTQTTIVYTVVVTPSIVNCPTTKTIAITAVNPPTPTITAIPNMCKNGNPYQIIVSPTGGSFNSGITGTNNPISQLGGVISPTFANIGVNNFTYNISVLICGASQTGSYQVSQFNTAALSSPTIPAQCTTNGPFNLMNIVQSSINGVWSGPGVQSGTSLVPGSLNGNTYTGPSYTNFYTLTYNTTSSPNPTVCPASSTLNVAVTKTMTPVIVLPKEFCTNSPAFTMTVNPSGGVWSNQLMSSIGVVTPSNAIGNNVPSTSTAFYSVSIGPCLNTANTILKVYTFNPAIFTGTIGHLCATSNPVNLMSIAQNTNGSWSASNQLYASSVSGNTFAPTGLQTGIYTLKYTTFSTPATPGNTLCPDFNAIAVSVLNPQVPNIANIGPICNNSAAVELTVSPSTGKWTTTPYLSNSGVFTPSLSSIGNNAIQYVVGTNTCNSQQTKFISVEGFVSAKIMIPLADQCASGNPVNLSPLTLNSLGVWNGPGINGTTFNPALTGAGIFTLTHNTSSSPSGLCPDQDMMAVNVYSLGTPVLTQIAPLCNSAKPMQIQVSPVGGLFGGNTMGIVSLAGKFDPSMALIGDNIINYSITSGPCVAYAQITVTVEKFISADFEKSLNTICRVPGETNPINMNSYVQNTGGNWTGNAMVGDMFDPFKALATNGNIVLYTTYSTNKLCSDTSSMRIEVRDVPLVTATTNKNSGCSPAEFEFNSPSGGLGVGTWNFGDGSEDVNASKISHVFVAPGSYQVTYSYTDEIGCKAKPFKVTPVTVLEKPKADFTVPDEIFISNPDIQLTNLTTLLGNNTYQWKVISTSYTTDVVNPIISLNKIGKYQITLIATTVGEQCKDEITKTIEVKNDFNIYIPTSFTPNYDGLNDFFIPVFSEYGLDFKTYEMEIFDRWGHSVYRTKDVTKGWDGSVNNKGEPLKEEVYIYRIRYKDLDGNAYNKMGHVSMLK